MAKTIGIDLGTTNSCMAILEGGDPTVIENAEGARTTPSVVAFTSGGEGLVGTVAKRQAVRNPENTVFSIKRFMDRKEAEVKEEEKIVPFTVVKGPNGDARGSAGGKESSPPEISAMILQKLKADAESYLGDTVDSAVITVPAYFNDDQRQATKDAGKIAGLEVKRIINEPTAASLAYGLDKETDQTILVFDLGGGTFDVSVLEIGDGVFEVKATSGDNHLGGDNWDKAIVEWLVAEFKRDQGVDLSQDKNSLQRLYEAAEKAKIELSTTQETQINLPFITATDAGPKHLDIKLSRSKLNELTSDLLERIVSPVKQALSDAGGADIQHVVLVGGNKSLGKFQLTGIPPAPRGMPQIEVTFDIDANGILNVSAKDLGTGKEQKIEIKGGSGLDETEVEQMIKDAESHADEDRRQRELAEARNVAENAAYQAEKQLEDLGDKVDESAKSEIEAAIKDVRDEYLELAQRTRADFENYRKRVANETSEARARGKAELARELLPVIDNLERALQTDVDARARDSATRLGEPHEALVRGVELVHKELRDRLES